jgi:hypothetical protein
MRFNHEYVGTEHILLALVKEGGGVGARALKNLHVDLRMVRLQVDKLIKSAPKMIVTSPLAQTPRAKKVLEYAVDESRQLRDRHVGTEHLLLGLLREDYGVAAQILINLSLNLEMVRNEVVGIMEGSRDDQSHAHTVSHRADASMPELSESQSPQNSSLSTGRDENTITTGFGLVLLPQTDQFRSLFDDVITPAVLANNLNAVWAEDIFNPGVMLPRLWHLIRSARVIVADVSGHDANVMFGMGICYALQRLPILLVRDRAELPFCFRDCREVQYTPDLTDTEDLKCRLSYTIERFLVLNPPPPA